MIDNMDGKIAKYDAWNRMKRAVTYFSVGAMLLHGRDAEAKNIPTDIMPGPKNDAEKVLVQAVNTTPNPIEQTTGTDPVGTEIAALPPTSSDSAPLSFQAKEVVDENSIAMIKNKLGLDPSITLSVVEEKLPGYDFGSNKIYLINVNGITTSYVLSGEPAVLSQLDVTSVAAIKKALGISSEVSIQTQANIRLTPSRSGELVEKGAVGGPFNVIGYENADGYGWYKILFTKKDGSQVEAYIADVGNISVNSNLDQFKEKPLDFSQNVLTQVRQEIPADQLEAMIATLPEYYATRFTTLPGLQSYISGNNFLYKISDVYALNPDGTPNMTEPRTRLDFVVMVNGVQKYFFITSTTSILSNLNAHTEADQRVQYSNFGDRATVGSVLSIEPVVRVGNVPQSTFTKACTGLGFDGTPDCERFKNAINALDVDKGNFPNILGNADANDPANPIDLTSKMYIVAVGF